MTRTLLRSALVAALSGVALTESASVHAQGAAPPESSQAVSIAADARRLYEAGQFKEARDKFVMADRIAHSPVMSLYIARCERNVGRLVAARDAYRKLVAEVLPAEAPPQWTAAKADAERDLAALEPRIPRVKIEAPEATGATTIQLDGVAVSAAARAEPLWVDPGEHTLARADGGAPVERKIQAVEGAAPLTVELPLGSAAASPGPAPAPTPAPADDGGGGTLVPGLVVLGVGVVGLGVGVATGLVASSKTSTIEETCVDGHCPRSQESAGDSAQTFASLSTVSFIVGGVASAAGVVLLVTLGGDDDPAQAAHRERLEIAPTVGGAQGTWVF